MSKHVDKLQKEVDDAKDKLDAYKRRVGGFKAYNNIFSSVEGLQMGYFSL